jgi:hypothetical protein
MVFKTPVRDRMAGNKVRSHIAENKPVRSHIAENKPVRSHIAENKPVRTGLSNRNGDRRR